MTRTALLLAGSLLALTTPAAGGDIVDLTHPFSGDSIYWPTAEPFQLRVDSRGYTAKGHYYEANSFCTAEHGGTHLDAPIHFAEGMATVDEIPLQRLVAPGIVVDVRAGARADRDYLVSAADLEAWEKRHGRIPEGTIVLLSTGWGERYPDAARYLGTARRGAEAVPELHFPGLAPEGARLLVERRGAAVGIDTASIDHGPSETFRSHVILFTADIPAFENVAALDQLPPSGFRVVALPMKIAGGSGGPLRIIALLE